MSDLFPVNNYFWSNRAVIWPDHNHNYLRIYHSISIDDSYSSLLLNIYDSFVIRHTLVFICYVIRYESTFWEFLQVHNFTTRWNKNSKTLISKYPCELVLSKTLEQKKPSFRYFWYLGYPWGDVWTQKPRGKSEHVIEFSLFL